ncbi:MAG TPA: hypothetical protein VJR22_02305 [Candidatus Nitrosotalea sp.]|nr:hypothetical protein [Candidatus Nitrosotalea sp.]
MVNSKAILIISGILVIAGILISFFQSETETSNLASSQQDLSPGSSMNVTNSLDPIKSKDGVYSIQISDFKDGDILSANVVDPNGNFIVTKSITKSPFQENFTISSTGTYELKIQNTAQGDMQVLGIIGYYPEGATLLDVFSVIILIVGLSGLAIGMMYFIKNRSKRAN